MFLGSYATTILCVSPYFVIICAVVNSALPFPYSTFITVILLGIQFVFSLLESLLAIFFLVLFYTHYFNFIFFFPCCSILFFLFYF